MSYCRFAWDGSDVYVFESQRGLECCGCWLSRDAGNEDFVAEEPEQMIVHLAIHRRAGHYVPYHAIESLWSEIPGALRPTTPEPPVMTHARLIAHRFRLDLAITEAEARIDTPIEPETVQHADDSLH